MLALPERIWPEVEAWRNQGYHPFGSETTRQLLAHWFDRDEEQGDSFHECQRRAIETMVYLHEVRAVRTVRQVYEQFDPKWLSISLSIKEEADSIPFMKYCFKMATGSGKTWVLAALIVWQHFNVVNGESGSPWSARFMIVTPGLEVRHRIIDSFRGRYDPKSGRRNPESGDYKRPLFMPDGPQWRGRFHLLENVLEPDDIRANASPPDGPFVAITNWQQFVRPKADRASLAEQWGLSIPEEPQGEIVADFMTEHPDLIVLNDEAHHVHGKKTTKAEELVWRRFMGVLHDRMIERHGDKRGLFMQVDFSATPFYGSGQNKEFFPHIVYDYDLRDALNDMLVKQLFVEERPAPEGRAALKSLDFRATRGEAEKGRRGAVEGLSADQMRLLEIGTSKLNHLTGDFVNKGLSRKPVLMVLCEETEVADLVRNYLVGCENYKGDAFGERGVLLFHSNLTKEKHGYTLDEARGGRASAGNIERKHPTLDDIDDDEHPLQIVISVLALREGFDKTNICVTCVLRATEADMRLEQIVGRGLRLMFPPSKYPELQEAKRQSFERLQNREKPFNSLDFLYIVEHPRFKTFYDELRRQGYLIGAGDSSDTPPIGDLTPVQAAADRIPGRDIAWPVAVQDESSLPDITKIDAASLPTNTRFDFGALQSARGTAITDRHLETGTKAQTWKVPDKWFDYNHFLRSTADLIAKHGRTPLLTGKKAEIAAIVDEYTTRRLFRREIDFTLPQNYRVLTDPAVQGQVVEAVRGAIAEMLGQVRFEVRRGVWRRVSELRRIFVREDSSIAARKSIYPRVGVPAHAGGLERGVMEELLEASPEVEAWCKLQRKHGLRIVYRDVAGLQRTYDVDFVLRTAESCFLLETKADTLLTLPSTGLKARAAKTWCESISGVKPEGEGWPEQPATWEYLLRSEGLWEANAGVSFEVLLPMMRRLRDNVIAEQFHGGLFG